jgi:hypothetical protein
VITNSRKLSQLWNSNAQKKIRNVSKNLSLLPKHEWIRLDRTPQGFYAEVVTYKIHRLNMMSFLQNSVSADLWSDAEALAVFCPSSLLRFALKTYKCNRLPEAAKLRFLEVVLSKLKF